MKTLDDRIKELCTELKVPEPIEFLTQVMAGHDPRMVSRIYTMILAFEERYGEQPPDEWDWFELAHEIKERYRYFPVTLSDSHAAAKQILEYTHSKKKQIEHTGEVKETKVAPELTPSEIRLFRKKFYGSY